jgi:hypothetical protein
LVVVLPEELLPLPAAPPEGDEGVARLFLSVPLVAWPEDVPPAPDGDWPALSQPARSAPEKARARTVAKVRFMYNLLSQRITGAKQLSGLTTRMAQ